MMGRSIKYYFLLLIFLAGCYNLSKVETIPLKMPELNKMRDGVYTGQYNGKMVSAKLEITLIDRRIVEVKLKEHNTLKGKRAEILAERIVEKQSVELDAISGSTASSNVILKAAENALRKAQPAELPGQ